MVEETEYLNQTPTPHVIVTSPTHMTQRSLMTIFLVAGILMATAIGILISLSFHLEALQLKDAKVRKAEALQTQSITLGNRVAGYKNRSVSCANLAVQIGKGALPASCLEKEVLAFYNPNQVAVAIGKSTAATNILGLKNRAATCEGQYVLGVRFHSNSSCVKPEVLEYWDPKNPTAYKP